jgi:hypothetical protein
VTKQPTGRVIKVVVEDDQQVMLATAAKRAGIPLATYVRLAAIEKATRETQTTKDQDK